MTPVERMIVDPGACGGRPRGAAPATPNRSDRAIGPLECNMGTATVAAPSVHRAISHRKTGSGEPQWHPES